jgi:hypothetical protein
MSSDVAGSVIVAVAQQRAVEEHDFGLAQRGGRKGAVEKELTQLP